MARILAVILLILTSLPARAELDIASWDALLGEAVVEGQVDYRAWRDNPDFEVLVEQIAAADLSDQSREQLLVFYINAYNILAAQGILSGSSPSSLLGRYTYFKRDKYEVAGQTINLYDLEHELIRPLGEPRIHFAIVCASESCPVLRNEAYSLDRLDAQLDDATRTFINDERRNRFDADREQASLSKIFDWFEEDFEAASGSIQQYLVPYVEDASVAELLKQQQFRVKYMRYQWGLNGVK